MNFTTNIRHAIRMWWRPLTCVGIALTMFVHGVILPVYQTLFTSQPFNDLSGLSLLIGSVAAAFAVREWGKVKGTE